MKQNYFYNAPLLLLLSIIASVNGQNVTIPQNWTIDAAVYNYNSTTESHTVTFEHGQNRGTGRFDFSGNSAFDPNGPFTGSTCLSSTGATLLGPNANSVTGITVLNITTAATVATIEFKINPATIESNSQIYKATATGFTLQFCLGFTLSVGTTDLSYRNVEIRFTAASDGNAEIAAGAALSVSDPDQASAEQLYGVTAAFCNGLNTTVRMGDAVPICVTAGRMVKILGVDNFQFQLAGTNKTMNVISNQIPADFTTMGECLGQSCRFETIIVADFFRDLGNVTRTVVGSGNIQTVLNLGSGGSVRRSLQASEEPPVAKLYNVEINFEIAPEEAKATSEKTSSGGTTFVESIKRWGIVSATIVAIMI